MDIRFMATDMAFMERGPLMLNLRLRLIHTTCRMVMDIQLMATDMPMERGLLIASQRLKPYLYYGYPTLGYGYGYGYGKRSADAEPAPEAKPYYAYGYPAYGYYGYGKRSADAEPAPE